MKIEYIRLKNYIGIYNGLGLDDIFIDLRTSTKHLILIHGDNGSGKSTLLNALSPFPDDNNSFIPGRPADKELLISNGNIAYILHLIHGINSRGERETTKAYIGKIVNGEISELNPNGNVGSYKDILYDEFSLNPNYISLSKLSMDNKGLVDKTPSERKRFINGILESLNVYNSINKALTKKSTVLKSMVNSINSKIMDIGDPNKLRLDLKTLNSRVADLSDERDDILAKISSARTIISVMDPDGSIQDSFKSIYESLNDLADKRTTFTDKITSILLRLNLVDYKEDDIYKLNKQISDEINDISVDIQIMESSINNQLQERENQYNELNAKTERLKALNNNTNYEELKTTISECKNNIKKYEKIFIDLNISHPENISYDEYLTAMDALQSIKDMIYGFKADITNDVLVNAIDLFSKDTFIDTHTIEDSINGIDEVISADKEKMVYYRSLLSVTDKLNLRPKDCSIETCPFIVDAVNAMRQSPEENIDLLTTAITENEKIKLSYESALNRAIEINDAVNDLNVIERTIDSYSRILSKLPINNILFDKNILIERLTSSSFKEIDILLQYHDLANIFENYKYEKERLIVLNNNLSIFESKMDLIGLLENDISSLNSKLTLIAKEIDDNSSKILELKKSLKSKKDYLLDLDTLIDLYSGLREIDQSSNSLKSKYSAIHDNINKINDAVSTINKLQGNLAQALADFGHAMKARDNISHSVKLLNEYMIELDKYQKDYQYIETIKEYSSPTTGIQNQFISMFMNRILGMSNELLLDIFGGRFQIPEFIINEREFRIPCRGDGIPNDDISSMSASQKCSISMILSFSLLYEASSKYNVICLDEIDAPLDSEARLQFLNILNKQINRLGISQAFMISHNNEIDYNDCDLIVLKSRDNFNPDNYSILYDYNK